MRWNSTADGTAVHPWSSLKSFSGHSSLASKKYGCQNYGNGLTDSPTSLVGLYVCIASICVCSLYFLLLIAPSAHETFIVHNVWYPLHSCMHYLQLECAFCQHRREKKHLVFLACLIR
mmetsp:Transcript_103540/g.178415  ORF Transcript_103540/g.178415 Transcript_103540/m.178415 type:complete len:118 (-) Transcript_103540:8-361(-)